MAEQFCLKWNNHQSTLISVFDTLLETGKHVDCSLAAEGKILRAHKVVLSACSPYLEDLLNHEKDRYPVLVFSDVRYDYLKAMLDYMYRGEVNVLQDHLNGFLKAAETLQIKGLTDQGGGGVGGEKRKGGVVSPIRERSNSPVSLPAKRRRQRRPSLESDTATHDSSNSCDNLPPVAVAPSPSLQASSKVEQPEPPVQRVSVPPPAPPLQPKLEPGVDHSQPSSATHQTSLVVQPKTEFIEEATDEQIEDLTLDDDDDDSYMAKPGSSSAHGNDSQVFGNDWHMNSNRSNDQLFLGEQSPVVSQNETQDEDWDESEDGGDKDGADETECLTTTPDLQVEGGKVKKSSRRVHGVFTCEQCGRTYIRKDSLQRHALWECGKEPRFQCPFCPQKCKRKSHHIRHIQRQHKDMLDLIVEKDPMFISE